MMIVSLLVNLKKLMLLQVAIYSELEEVCVPCVADASHGWKYAWLCQQLAVEALSREFCSGHLGYDRATKQR